MLDIPSQYMHSDDDRIVSHDASHLGLYYHCIRDIVIYSMHALRMKP